MPVIAIQGWLVKRGFRIHEHRVCVLMRKIYSVGVVVFNRLIGAHILLLVHQPYGI